MNKEDLIGRKVLGFKFDSDEHSKVNYEDIMDKCIGKEGIIIEVSKNSYCVNFGATDIWSYPIEEIEKYLVTGENNHKKYPLTPEESFTVKEEQNKRVFETGSKRDDDSNKPLVNHLDPYLRLRFGYLLREGANKYDKGNWRKLQPTETALESLHRHLAKYEKNMNDGVEQDEDHLGCIIFNVMLIMKNEEKEGIPVNHYYGKLK